MTMAGNRKQRRAWAKAGATDRGAERGQTPALLFDEALTLHEANRFSEAEARYQRLLAIRPDDVAVLSNLGLALDQQSRHGEAIPILRQALGIRSDHPQAWIYLAKSLQHARHWEEAEGCYRQALRYAPNLAALHINHGLVLHELGRSADAVAAFRQALVLEPGSVLALGNLAKVLRSMGEVAEAETAYRSALILQPTSSELHADLAGMIIGPGRFDEAVTLARRAVELDRSNGPGHVNLAQALLEANRLEEARAAFEDGVNCLPDYAEAHFGLAQVLLTQGQYDRGWSEYEWRWRTKANQDHAYHTVSLPLWQGEDLAGRTIFVHAEQGIGDSVQFIRYIPGLMARGATVMLACPASLHRLFGAIDGLILLTPAQSSQAADVRVALMSLPRLFKTSLSTIPASVPYLSVAETDVRGWRARMGSGGLKIGLVWAGNPNHVNDRNRSLPLRLLTPLFGLANLQWFSLQKEAPAGDQALLCALHDHVMPLPVDDFSDTAAAVSALDLVISVDTSVCHLTGALGRPVWVLLPFAPDWRWLLDREDSPWYPSMRLFRQKRPGDWEEVIERLATRIGSLSNDQKLLTHHGA